MQVYFTYIFTGGQNMTFEIENTQWITFIRLKACCAKKNKSSIEILVSIHSYDIRD